MILRDYQEKEVDAVVSWLRAAGPGDKTFRAAPCGTGKGVIEAAILERLKDSFLLTPRTEIIDSLVDKGAPRERISTPLTYRNRLLSGDQRPAKYLLIDEGHHDTNVTSQQVRLCVGEVPTAAFSATPYRGTPQGTAALRDLYGPPHWIITMKEAANRGFLTVPQCETVPILDDDLIEVNNGEFSVKRVDEATPWEQAANLVQEASTPTVVSLPSVWACKRLQEILHQRHLHTNVVTADTGREDRLRAFSEVLTCTPLLQVNVVSEGVDLPLRRLVDLAPTLSPVKWLQQIGRIMRPGPGAVYKCANRNLLRHGYLLEGLIPSAAFSQAQGVFPQQSNRLGYRAFGLEGVGRMKPAVVPLANGTKAQAYYVTERGTLVADMYVAVVLPDQADVLWAHKTKSRNAETGELIWSRWAACAPPAELTGFTSVPPNPLTPKQKAWWDRKATYRGLDVAADVDAKVFGVLPVLEDLNLRIKS